MPVPSASDRREARSNHHRSDRPDRAGPPLAVAAGRFELAAFGQSKRTQSSRRHVSHDPGKHVPDPIGDGHRFSDKITRKQIGV
jgi:hypothetical protein